MDEKKTVVAFLGLLLRAADIPGKRPKVDVFADRLLRATSEPTLNKCIGSLLDTTAVELSALRPEVVTSMYRIGNGDSAARLLAWLRQYHKFVVMLATTDDETAVVAALETLSLPEVHSAGTMAVRQPHDIAMVYSCEAPLAHGGDIKAGNATLFRRIKCRATNGAILYLPYYSGNSVRGIVRDLLADHFCERLSIGIDTPPLSLWMFYAIYSGGALEEKSGARKALRKSLGDNGAIRGPGIRAFREHLPALSLLGCALGNRVLPGRVRFADLRPRCLEWGTGTHPVSEMLTWEFLTRREVNEEHERHTGMIANTEVLQAGSILDGGIDLDSAMTDIETAAMGTGIKLLQKNGYIGAQNRMGFGKVNIETTHAPAAQPYGDWLRENKTSIIEYLDSIGGFDDARD
jgi:hypothetical protein